jgi:HEAT repeat protein
MRGAILARTTTGVRLLLEKLRGSDPTMAEVALWVVQHELPGAPVPQVLAAELPKLPVDKQLLLTRALCARGDPAALPAVLSLAKSGEKSVRLTAITGLAQFPGGPVANALAGALADPDDEIARAAQAVLENLRGKEVDAAVTALLEGADKAARLRAVQLVGARLMTGALPLLLRAARQDEKGIRLAALKVLEELAGPNEVPALLDLLTNAATAEDRTAAEEALGAACGKLADSGACVEKLIGLLPQASPPLKQALLRLLHRLGGSSASQAVLAATRDGDAEVKATAFRLLGEWKTAEVAPDLLQLAKTSAAPNDRLLCLRSYLRLAGNKDVPADQRLTICREAAALVQREEEKKLLLGMLGGLETPAAFPLVTPFLDDAATKDEAAAAILSLAEKLAPGPGAAQALEPLQKAAHSTANPDLAKRAEALLTKLQAPAP